MAYHKGTYGELEDSEMEAMKRAEETRNGRISSLINQATKLTHIIDEQVGSLSERLQPITRPSAPEPAEDGMGTIRDEDPRRDSPMAEQINALIRRLQRLQIRLGELPDRLDV